MNRAAALFPLSPLQFSDVCLRLTQAIVHTRNRDDIFAAALDALHAAMGVERAAILLFDIDGVMRFEAWRGLSEAYRHAVEGHSPWPALAKHAEPLVVPDVTDDAALSPYLPVLRAEGIAGLTFVPLEAADGVIGKFMLYYDEPRTLSPVDLQPARVIAAQVAFAIQRTQADLLARQSEERLAFALQAADMGTWDWDLRTQVIRWSGNMESLHGLPRGSFDGTFEAYERGIHPDDRPAVMASIQRAISAGAMHDVEYRIVNAAGVVRWVEGKGHLEHGPNGHLRMTGVCMNITRRKQDELARIEALKESHRASQRLAAIVASSQDAIVGKDLRGVITSWNGGAERMFGYTADEAIGQSITMIIPPDRLGEEQTVLARLRANQSVELETVRQRKDGTFVDISLMVSPILDTDGRTIGAAKIARDISARRRDEAERAELDRRLRLLITASASLLDSPESESVQSATVSLARQLLDADGYAMWMLDSEAAAWSVVRSEGISTSFAGRVVPDPSVRVQFGAEPIAVPDVTAEPLVAAQLDAYQAEGIRALLSCPMRLGGGRAGTLAFYFHSPQTFRDVEIQTGQALANLAAAALTTAALYDEQRTERALAEAAHRQAAFLADATAMLSRSSDDEALTSLAHLAVPDFADWCAIDIVDSTGRLERRAEACTGEASQDDTRSFEMLRPDGAGTVGGPQEVFRTGRTAAMALKPVAILDDPDSSSESPRALASYICVPLVSTRGTLGTLTFAFAESGRHYADSDVAFVEDVAARAALAIENAFAYRRAHEANRLKDEFLATLSHELRTPLNAILGYAQLLSLGALDAERQSKAFAVVTRNAESLRQIIEEVLDVARITFGKIRLNMRPVTMDEVLRHAVTSVRRTADAKGVWLQLTVDAQMDAVFGDPERLQQIAWNLLSNAVKFTPRGGHVHVRLERMPTAVRVVVSDDGDGIDAAFLPHIFERFRQADSRFSRAHGGLGLGLAIVQELVELHGGTVSAASPGLGQGATFTAVFPAVASADRSASDVGGAGAGTRQAAAPVLAVQLKGIRLLAVDDEEDALGLLRIILESAGADVTTAGSAPRAIDLLKAGTFDALISDIGMPRMDGLELIRTVRHSLPSPGNSIPAAALTSYARSDDRVAVLSSGFQMHIAKPIDPAELVAAVSELVGRP